MAAYEAKTIEKFIEMVDKGEVILPAMQRDFVWKKEKIYKLFESLMRGYPIGTFILWKVGKDEVNEFAFNSFVKNYDERIDNSKRDRIKAPDKDTYYAVLDGQQRITSLFMGLKGSYIEKEKSKAKGVPPKYVSKILCVNVLFTPEPDAENLYEFRFVSEEETETLIDLDDGNYEYWMPVRHVLPKKVLIGGLVKDATSKNPDVFTSSRGANMMEILETLREEIRSNQNIFYYTAEDVDLSEVSEIFVRVNSQGQKLDASDLMLSIATASMREVDIHELLQDKVREINKLGHNKIDKDFILTTGLMCVGSDSLSLEKRKNFSNVDLLTRIFVDEWENIITAITLAVQYVDAIGFKGIKVGKNILCVVAYYFYKNNTLTYGFCTGVTTKAKKDRILIRQWILRAIMKKIFVEGTGSSLITIRSIIDESSSKGFPLEDLMTKYTRRSLRISEDNVEDLLSLKYPDGKIQPILAEICHYDSVESLDVDHIFPKDLVSRKTAFIKHYPEADEEILGKYRERIHRLPNLQLLDGGLNSQKKAMAFDAWMTKADKTVLERNLVDSKYLAFKEFLQFFEERKEILKDRIRQSFPDTIEEIFKNHGI